MLRIVGAILVLLAVGWLASRIPNTSSSETAPPPAWRRTCDGWERANTFVADLSRQPPSLHPAVFGLGLMFLALAGFIGFASEPENKANARSPIAVQLGELDYCANGPK